MGFQFKEFTVDDSRCAMKVGTDGVLIGAWCTAHFWQQPKCSAGLDILDVGAGSGLISLMMAQRMPEARVVGIELDLDAASQARENVARSRFSDRIEIAEGDFTTYGFDRQFDLIVSNPPYFEREFKGARSTECASACDKERFISPEEFLTSGVQRETARHTVMLSFETLTTRAAELLSGDGRFAVILPYSARTEFIGLCAMQGLFLSRETRVQGGQGNQGVQVVQEVQVVQGFKRVMLEFGREIHPTMRDELTIGDERYKELTNEFYI